MFGGDGDDFSFAAYGTKGLAEITRADLSHFRFAPASTAAPTGLVAAPADEIAEHSGFDMLHEEMTAFARAIRDGNSYPVRRRRAAWYGGIRRDR